MHDYSSFAVSTIDSYFQLLSKTLSRELKLPIHYSIELDTDNIADTVTDRVLELSGKNPQITLWLEELLFDNIENNKGWNLKPELKAMVKEIINRPIVHAFSNALSTDEYQTYVRNLKSSRTQLINEIHSKCNDILTSVQNHGYSKESFKGKSTSAVSFVEKLSKEKYKITDIEISKTFLKEIGRAHV